MRRPRGGAARLHGARGEGRLISQMSVSYFVRYDIEAGDLKAFLRRYREVHVPLVARWPGLRRMVLHTPLAWRDPFPVNPGKAVLMVG